MILAGAQNLNKLFHIDPASLEIVAVNSLICKGAHTIIMDQNRHYIYTADSHGSAISMTDMILSERKTASVGASPSHIQLCKKNGMFYVANYDSDCVSVVDEKTMTSLVTIKTGSMPHHLCLSDDETLLFVSLMGSNQISIIDTGSNKIVGHLNLWGTPMHMYMGSGTGKLYVACTDFEKSTRGEIVIIDEEKINCALKKKTDKKEKPPRFKRCVLGRYLSDICIVEDDRMLYAVDGQENMLYALDLITGEITCEVKTGEFPSTIEYDKETDRIFVGTHIENCIEGYDRKSLKFIGKCKIGDDFGHIFMTK